MNVALWIVQSVLALAFVAAGVMKTCLPISKLRTNMAWVDTVGQPGVKTIGSLEFLGGLGLVLPAALKVAVILTPLAAIGLALTMVGAILLHIKRGEPAQTIPSLVLLLMLAFVVWGRLGPYQF
jgi:uncharacterized membrane protein YphA (DoxX/SURF4 family)